MPPLDPSLDTMTLLASRLGAPEAFVGNPSDPDPRGFVDVTFVRWMVWYYLIRHRGAARRQVAAACGYDRTSIRYGLDRLTEAWSVEELHEVCLTLDEVTP